MESEKQQTVSEIIEQVAAEICDQYCRYPDMYRGCEDIIDFYCSDCPLNRLF